MKRWLMFSVLFLVVLCSLVSATDSCSGFWGSVSCLLWGDPSLKSNIAGEATRGNLVGEVAPKKPKPVLKVELNGNVVVEEGEKVVFDPKPVPGSTYKERQVYEYEKNNKKKYRFIFNDDLTRTRLNDKNEPINENGKKVETDAKAKISSSLPNIPKMKVDDKGVVYVEGEAVPIIPSLEATKKLNEEINGNIKAGESYFISYQDESIGDSTVKRIRVTSSGLFEETEVKGESGKPSTFTYKPIRGKDKKQVTDLNAYEAELGYKPGAVEVSTMPTTLGEFLIGGRNYGDNSRISGVVSKFREVTVDGKKQVQIQVGSDWKDYIIKNGKLVDEKECESGGCVHFTHIFDVRLFSQTMAKGYLGDGLAKQYKDLYGGIVWNYDNKGNLIGSVDGKEKVKIEGLGGDRVDVSGIKKVVIKTEETKGDKKVESEDSTYISSGGTKIASVRGADKESGKVSIGGQDAYVKNVDELESKLKTGDEILGYASKEEAGKEGAIPQMSLIAKDEIITTTKFQSISTGVFADGIGTQTVVDTKKGITTTMEGDYYQGGKGEGDCNNIKNCFIPSKGEMRDAEGKLLYLLDADTTGTGKDQELVKTELYNPQTGRYEGEISPDGSSVVAEFKDGKYTGNMIVTDKDGSKEIYTKDEKIGKWKLGDKELSGANLEEADSIKSHTTGGIALAQSAVESIYAIENSIRSYPALSQLIFKDLGGTDAVQKWQSKADQTFAPMLGSNWFPSAVCEGNSAIGTAGTTVLSAGLASSGNRDINVNGHKFIKTVSGTYQAVASVQGERSKDKSPLLCYANPDTEAKIKYICDEGQVCKDDGFCYANEDAEKPLEGYFYKITWAVSAPQDEKLTPLVDENGVAVTFNIVLKDADKEEVRLYNKNGNNQFPIELNNGAKDRDVITHYSNKDLKNVCIVWGKTMKTVTTIGTEDVPPVCFEIEHSSVGKSAWEASVKSEGSGATTTVSSGKVSKNTQW